MKVAVNKKYKMTPKTTKDKDGNECEVFSIYAQGSGFERVERYYVPDSYAKPWIELEIIGGYKKNIAICQITKIPDIRVHNFIKKPYTSSDKTFNVCTARSHGLIAICRLFSIDGALKVLIPTNENNFTEIE